MKVFFIKMFQWIISRIYLDATLQKIVLFLAGISFLMNSISICLASTDIPLSTSDVKIDGRDLNTSAGYRVFAIDDVNRDGFKDFAVSAAYPARVGIFLGRASGAWPLFIDLDHADVLLTGENPEDRFGECVVGGGDVNGDGIKDIAISAPWAANEAGKIYVIYGRRSGWVSGSVNLMANASFVGTFERMGSRGSINGFAGNEIGVVSMSGSNSIDAELDPRLNTYDFNGDGLADLAIGSINPSPVSSVYIFFGRRDGWRMNTPVDSANAFCSRPLSELTRMAGFGTSFSFIGDLNRDGLNDLVVGTPQYWIMGRLFDSDPTSYALGKGRIDIYLGERGAGGNIPAAHYIEGDYPPPGDSRFSVNRFGSRIAPAGDVNRDGFADFLVSFGADSDDVGVILGSPRVTDLRVNTRIHTRESSHSAENEDYLTSISGNADINGDGVSDIVIGVTSSLFPEGRSFVFYGSAYGWGPSLNAESDADLRILSEGPRDYAGISVALTGDVNGDRRSEILIGASDHSSIRERAGRAYLIFGSRIPFYIWLYVYYIPSSTFAFTEAEKSWGDFQGDEMDVKYIQEKTSDLNQ